MARKIILARDYSSMLKCCLLFYAELVFAYTADGAYPVIGKVFKSGACEFIAIKKAIISNSSFFIVVYLITTLLYSVYSL